MSNLDNYVEYIKRKINKIENITETEIIRYVYLDLGNRFSFDLNYIYGNSETKRKIYERSRHEEELELCMEKNTAVCKSLAYICEYILKKIGIDIKTVLLDEYGIRKPHVYNVITEKNGRQYILDLQQDLENIQSHSRTECFGVQEVRSKQPIISLFELEQIDKKLGYIQKDNYYSDEYLYLLKSDICYFENLEEKLHFLLENIDIHENKNMKYMERKWHHATILKKLLNVREFSKVHFINCYENTEKDRDYKNCIVFYSGKGPKVYIYSIEENKYILTDINDFARKVKNGQICTEQFLGLKKVIKNLEKPKKIEEKNLELL